MCHVHNVNISFFFELLNYLLWYISFNSSKNVSN
ncbi:hypothetical protein 7t3_015 [Salmonella phage 7t3]|nr:hypothetical protein 7t3_015 [Salmonella phage 7t3]